MFAKFTHILSFSLLSDGLRVLLHPVVVRPLVARTDGALDLHLLCDDIARRLAVVHHPAGLVRLLSIDAGLPPLVDPPLVLCPVHRLLRAAEHVRLLLRLLPVIAVLGTTRAGIVVALLRGGGVYLPELGRNLIL